MSHSSIGGSSARGYVMGMDDTVQRNDESPRQMGHRKHCHARDGLYKGGGVLQCTEGTAMWLLLLTTRGDAR